MGKVAGGESPAQTPLRQALAGLLADPLWAAYFEKCCREGSAKLGAELGRFANALRADGIRHRREDVRSALGSLARERHPCSETEASPEGRASSDEEPAAQSPTPRGEAGVGAPPVSPASPGTAAAPEAQPPLGDISPDGASDGISDGTPAPVDPAPLEPPTPLHAQRQGRAASEGEYPEPEYPDGGHPEDGQPDASPAGAFEKISIAEESENARNALRALVEAVPDAAALYEKQCQQGLVGLKTRAGKLELMLDVRGEHHERAALEAAVTELAVETHPESAAAAWEGLLARRLRDCRVARLEKPSSGIRRVVAVVDLAGEEWGFKLLTHVALDPGGPDEGALLHASREMYAALRRRGRRVRPAGFSEHVWGALREVLPDAPGVRWDPEWADRLMRRAGKHLGARVGAGGYDPDRPGLARAEAEVSAAYASEDRRRYRRALREWVAATRPGAV